MRTSTMLALAALTALACTPARGRDDDEPTAGSDAGSAADGGRESDGGDGADAGDVPDAGEPGCPFTADCTARDCGPDPVCGVSCGSCVSGRHCGAGGTCVDDPPATGSGALQGSVHGHTFVPADAIVHGATVELLDRAGACAVIQRGRFFGHSVSLAFILNPNGPLVPGTYPADPFIDPLLAGVDAACATTFTESATSGTVVITHVDGAFTDGSFDIAFGSDHLTGTFHAMTCEFPAERSGCE